MKRQIHPFPNVFKSLIICQCVQYENTFLILQEIYFVVNFTVMKHPLEDNNRTEM